jgi:serine/threonine-protein kinase
MEAEPIEDTTGAQMANFSPDGERLSFMAEGRLKTVPVSGGPSTDLASSAGLTASWAPGDTLIYSPTIDGGLSQIPASGGSPTVLTTPDSTLGEFGHWLPVMLPDGKTVLFTIWTTGSLEETRIALLDLETREYRTIITGRTHARYASSGHLVYAKGETLMAAPFDLNRLEITDAAAPVVENVAMNIGNGQSYFDLSEDGSLIYVQARFQSCSIEWVDRDGNVETITDLGRDARTPDLSPGDGRLAVAITSESNEDIWTYDLSRGTLTRLTTEGRGQFGARWTPDGTRIAFSSDTPPYDIFWMPADGSGPAEPLVQGDEDKRLGDWSPDGRVLSYAQVSTTTQNDVWTITLDGDRPPAPFLQTPFAELHPAFSPDGRWLAYASDVSGRFEVYATPFPGPGERRQISTEGGTEPIWSSDGQELFYRSGDAVLAVAIDTDPALTIGPPRVLFERALGYSIQSNVRQYDVSADGRRFLMINKAQAAAGSTQINVVLNWFEELKRLVPSESD